jgi:preprotein translocase subunit YajC
MFLYGQQAAGGAPGGMNFSFIIMMVLMFGIFYFILIRPAKKQRTKHQNMINSLKGGERVVTTGGIYGTIGRVMDDRIELNIDKNTKIQIVKSSISSIIDPDSTESKSK